jgi:hypothetical protein
LHAFLDGRRMRSDEAGRGIGVHPNALRYAAPTGTVLMRWEGARLPVIWSVPRPEIDPFEARLELARRYMHVFGPTTPAAFAKWAGIGAAEGRAAFDALAGEVMAARTPVGDGWILTSDERSFRATPSPAAPARRRILPAPRSRSRASGLRRKPATRAVDPARLARRGAGGGRSRWDLATSECSRGDPNVATPLHRGTPSRRGRGGISTVARPKWPNRRPLGRLRQDGSRSEEALNLLASWAATPDQEETHADHEEQPRHRSGPED